MENNMATKKKAKAKAKSAPRITAIKTPMTKSAMQSAIAEKTELTKKQVASVMDELTNIINGHIKKGGAGVCTIPGLMKIKTVRKPARKARKGINPFTGEETVFKAKPASTAVKILALKAMKDMAN
jgi:nucleoid DNA-binding protein